MTILVCQCGARINAPGARPGRRGRCPNCGATLLVPEALPPLQPVAPPQVKPSTELATGYHVKPDKGEVSSYSAPKTERRSVRTERRTEEAEKALFLEKGGLIARPSKPETHVLQSLLYPIWDAPGFLFLVCISPILATFGLLSIGLTARFIVGRELSSAATVIPPILPGTLFFWLTLGYVFLFLNDVVRSSAYGDVHHPRAPSWTPSASLGAILRWVWALACGALVFSPLWWWFGAWQMPESTRQWLTAIALAVPTLVYAQMALVAVILFDDLSAANPLTVLRAIYRSGLDSLRVALATVLAAGVTVVCGVLLLRLPMFIAIPVSYAYAVLSLYMAMFVARSLGLYFRRNAKRIGWFPERMRWGAD